MKRRQRTLRLISAAAVLALLCLCLFLLRRRNRAESEQASERDMIIPWTVDQMKRISVGTEGKELVFEKEAGLWKCLSDPDLHPDQTKVGVLASSVTGVPVSQVLEDVDDLAPYGLEAPEKTLAVRKIGDGEEIVLRIGGINDTTMDVYCMEEGSEDTVYAVSTALTTCLDYDAAYYASEEASPSGTASGPEEMSGPEEGAGAADAASGESGARSGGAEPEEENGGNES